MATSALNCPSKMVKYFLFLFNVIFWLVGAVILGVGIWVLTDARAAELMHVATIETSDHLVHSAGGLLVAVGCFIFLTAFFGCYGACKESSCLLMIYAVIVGLVLFLQILAGILGAVFKDNIRDQLDDSMNSTVVERYGHPDYHSLTESYDFMQREFKCCGALNGSADWLNSYWIDNQVNTTDVVPRTCCRLVDMNKDASPAQHPEQCQLEAAGEPASLDEPQLWTMPCEQKLYDWVGDHVRILIGVAFGLMFVEIFVIIAACCLFRSFRNQYEYV